MKKLIIIFLLLLSGTSYASLTVNNVPQTKTGGSSPAVKDSSIWQVNGNVGIGSPNPGQALDVKGTVRATAFIGSIPSSSISGVIPISNLATGTPTGSKFIRDDGTLQVPAGGGGSGSSLWETNSIGIDTFNPVGIGSTSPTQALDVQGTIRSLSQFVNGNVGINTLSSTPIVQVTGGGIAGESVNKGYELILPSPNFGGGTTEVDSFLNYKGNLLVCFNEPNSALWTFDGNKYKLLHKFGSSHGQCDAIESYQGKLYAALVGNGGLNGSVQVSSDDGQTWSDSYLSSQDFDLYSLGVFKGKLYAGAGYLNSRIYSFDGTTWTQIYNGFPGGTAGLVQFLYVYKGLLFAGISNGAGGGVISSPDGTNFTTELNGISVTRFAEFRGHLYATTQAGGGNPNVYIRNDSTGTWTALTAILASQCWAVLPYNNALYVGCTDNTNGGLVYKSYDGFNFTLDFTNNYAGGKGTEPFAMYNYNGSLYIGMGFNGGAVADVWRKTDSIGQQTDWLNNFENTFRNNTYNGYNWPNDRSLISTTSPWDFDSNVGIGTGAPGQALDVQGTIRTTGFIYTTKPTSGYVLTTNSVGVGTWAPVSASGGGSGTVTSITAGSGLTGGTITTSGTVALDLTNANTWTGQQTFNTANVGIGSASPGKALDVQGTVRAVTFTKFGGTSSQFLKADGSIDSTSYGTGSGTVTSSNINTVAKFSATGTTVQGSGILFDDGTNIGIGTTGPITALQIIGSSNSALTSQIKNLTSGTLAEAKFSMLNSSGGVNSFGKLSAGYTPYKTLNAGDAYIYTSSANLSILNDNASGNINFTAGGASSPQVTISSAGNISTGGGYTQSGTTADTFTGTPTFSNATNSALFTGGNVGIGSATPGQILDVQGTIRSLGITVNANNLANGNGSTTTAIQAQNGQMFFSNILSSTPENELTMNGLGTNYLHFYNNGGANNYLFLGGSTGATTTPTSPTMSWNLGASSGNVGINITTPVNVFDVNGAMALGLYAGTNTAPSNGLIISGNVGIGTVNPGQILDVVGTVRFTNSLLNTKSTTGIGWTNKAGTNTACNTTCGTSACVIGIDTGTVGVLNSNFVACNDATADDCLCAGP